MGHTVLHEPSRLFDHQLPLKRKGHIRSGQRKQQWWQPKSLVQLATSDFRRYLRINQLRCSFRAATAYAWHAPNGILAVVLELEKGTTKARKEAQLSALCATK